MERDRDCSHVEELLSGYAARCLNRRDMDAVRRHLARCGSCRRLFLVRHGRSEKPLRPVTDEDYVAMGADSIAEYHRSLAFRAASHVRKFNLGRATADAILSEAEREGLAVALGPYAACKGSEDLTVSERKPFPGTASETVVITSQPPTMILFRASFFQSTGRRAPRVAFRVTLATGETLEGLKIALVRWRPGNDSETVVRATDINGTVAFPLGKAEREWRMKISPERKVGRESGIPPDGKQSRSAGENKAPGVRAQYTLSAFCEEHWLFADLGNSRS